MKPDEYIVRGAPQAWREYAAELNHSAEVLFSNHDKQIIVDVAKGALDPIRKSMISRTCLLLFGLSIENLVKGYMIARDPNLLAGGKLDDKLKTHNISKLFSKIPNFTLTKDELELVKIFDDSIPNWGRYPVPLKPEHYAKERILTQDMHAIYSTLFSRLDKTLFLFIREGWEGPEGIKITATIDTTYEIMPEGYEKMSVEEILAKRKLKD